MGLRCDQWAGLSPSAEKFLDSFPEKLLYKEKIIRTYPDGNVEEQEKDVRRRYTLSDSGDTYRGMFGTEYRLDRYTILDTGKTYVEFVQDDPWSSGPVFFMALKDEETGEVVKESLWTEEEIRENT